MDLFLGSSIAFERKHIFPLTEKWEFCCSYVKLPYDRDHRPTVPFTLEKRTDHHVARTFYNSYWTVVLPTDANSSNYVLRPVCTPHPNLSFYWLQNSPSPQVISHRLLVSSFLSFVTETQAFSNSWALLRLCTTPKLQAFQYLHFWKPIVTTP